MELQLATPKVIDLSWHIVTGSVEIEELAKYGKIWQYKPKSRQDLFLTMKYPNDIFYKGGWGPELLHFDREGDPYLGRTGKIYCTYERYRQIARWLLDNMFEP